MRRAIPSPVSGGLSQKFQRALTGWRACTFKVSVDYLLGMNEERYSMSPATYDDSRPITFIVDRARHNSDLTRLLVALLKLCVSRESRHDSG